MHHDACTNRVTAELVEQKLLAEIRRTRSLIQGASAAGARVHTLPERPRDIEDDGDSHFAVLGPKAASDSGRPSAEARRFIDETTGPDRSAPAATQSFWWRCPATVWMPPARASANISAGRK